ncbi:MAG: hypothetical protein UY97_C0005G0027 [Parcubacteria group bacterium GW2011_GWB1_57_6]|nr:MAG: hypothetical protein UY93_C0002G0268 [Parcubacteria group bacterium GW2011_GWA1_56_13]KKW46482.1 MAG: hypothetical protein UY97_C0005G0027 [Parcubacteria group bacterium GW2011_GWB1_57_6]
MDRTHEIFQKLEVGERGCLFCSFILSALLVVAIVGAAVAVGLWTAAILFP